MEGEREIEWLLRSEFHESHPSLSPDGRWLAYTTDESGGREVFVRSFPNVDDGRWQVSTDGGASPVWGRDSRELYYQAGHALIVVSNDTEPTFSPGTPVTLFDGLFSIADFPTLFDDAPNGQRFLTIREPEEGIGQPQIILVQNWFEELTRLVPTP